jgi:hypothetical protein
MLTITRLENENLRLSIDDSAREELRETINRATDLDHGTLAELLEDYAANGTYYPIAPGDGTPGGGAFVGLTDAPCIATDVTYEDDGTTTINGDIWCFPDYMVCSFVEFLHRDLFVDFVKT